MTPAPDAGEQGQTLALHVPVRGGIGQALGSVTAAKEQLGTSLLISSRCLIGKTVLPSPCLLALFLFSPL